MKRVLIFMAQFLGLVCVDVVALCLRMNMTVQSGWFLSGR
ncbi:hypothetical protein Z946_871 [Sulfitobacter noctilucicola]|nr:hypothetical protein Z946_871 [Sulfitobacter noctilucicola]